MTSFLRIISALCAFVAILGTIGLLLFPKQFERTALGFVQSEIEAELAERFPSLGAQNAETGLRMLGERFGLRQERLQEFAAGDFPDQIAAVIAAYCGCSENDAERTVAHAEVIREGLSAQMAKLNLAQSNLVKIIEQKYDEIITALRIDFLIFLLTNLIAFSAVLGATFLRSNRKNLTVYPAALLLTSVTFSSYFYVFKTDWFYTILFQDYWGLGYAVFIGIVFGFLVDIALNRARVTLQITSNLPSALVPVC